MRAIILLTVLLLTGCKTAEFAITHPATGIHLVARLEAKETPEPHPYYSHVASDQVATTVAKPIVTDAPQLLEPTVVIPEIH